MSDGTLALVRMHEVPYYRFGGRSEAELSELWERLVQPNVQSAYGAMRELCGSGEKGIKLLREKLLPRIAVSDRVRELIIDLDSNSPTVRNAAVNDLKKTADEGQLLMIAPSIATPEARGRVSEVIAFLSVKNASSAEGIRLSRGVMMIFQLARRGAPEPIRKGAGDLLKLLSESGAWKHVRAEASVFQALLAKEGR
jgi:hypothetical protein